MPIRLARRDLLTAFGASLFSGGPLCRLAEAADKGDKGAGLFAGAYMERQNRYGVAVFDGDGNILSRYRLPARGHGMASGAASPWLVAFARRPGNFALAIDVKSGKPLLFKSPSHTHFYGHGAFSSDGNLLFATENRFESGEGLIGIYDATDSFSRIAEIPSHGIGPHETVLMPDGHTLCVANGGIATHPDTGRAKLNLPEMQSSIVFIDSRHGEPVAKFDVPQRLQRLSLRHMAIDHEGKVWIGGQYEGDERDTVPLIATARPERGLDFPDLPRDRVSALSNYVGSVANSLDGERVAFSSPRGNTLLVVDAAESTVIKQQNINAVCGIASGGEGFLTTSLSGEIGRRRHPLHWDNHSAEMPHHPPSI